MKLTHIVCHTDTNETYTKSYKYVFISRIHDDMAGGLVICLQIIKLNNTNARK